ncbi:Alpha/Beta hydrolase fold [Rhodotorula toruloides]|uniref:Alpha/Beta hydrolase fold n=1 Tax=Rhodotorula toruloides TaxID=5286 RepID=A0A0K3CK31_RHOTO|nr:Alpha/Beta hydrolase fold [Rhodotorula toruloides]PRQ72633.1 Alpha/Beta hydrolase fold [Rhodotorula toruloides]
MLAVPKPVTFTFKTVLGVDYRLDVWLPEEDSLAKAGWETAPVLCYYHGGGLCAGNRDWNGWVPNWLFYGALEAGLAVISIDYTLLGPHNGTHVIDDVRDAMRFIHDELNTKLADLSKRQIDPKRISVCGSSAGGYVSYIAGVHSPVPLKAIISFYGGGGEFLVDWYLKEKKEPFFHDQPLITDPTPYRAILDAPIDSTPPTVRTPIDDPNQLRNTLFYYLLQTGSFLDVLSGTKGVTAELVKLPAEQRAQAVPDHVKRVVPHLSVSPSFPPTYLLHGALDSVVFPAESRNMHRVLQEAGVEAKLAEVEGGEHGFDTQDGWASGPGGQDEEMTRKRNETLGTVLPWLLERI